MQIDHVAVSSEEVTQIEQGIYPINSPYGQEHSRLPRWATIALSAAVAVLPLLCLLTVLTRIAIRHQPSYVKYTWICFLSTLLIISGVLSSMAAFIFLSLPRMPAILSRSIPDFDEREFYPHLPSMFPMDSSQVSVELKPLVIIVSPANRLWNGRSSVLAEFGAGVLLMANKEGYLFVTAKHVVAPRGEVPEQVMISTELGMRASADVVATAEHVDLALLWVHRRSGTAVFTQPIDQASEGETAFWIGHPDGLNYTLSTGAVSGLKGDDVQISAPISPGSSGGPMYDAHGSLIGIVSSNLDQHTDANAETPGFGINASILKQNAGWRFSGDGEARLKQYIQILESR